MTKLFEHEPQIQIIQWVGFAGSIDRSMAFRISRSFIDPAHGLIDRSDHQSSTSVIGDFTTIGSSGLSFSLSSSLPRSNWSTTELIRSLCRLAAVDAAI